MNQESDHDQTMNQLERLNKAVFGDGNGDIGMQRKMTEMYPKVNKMFELFEGAGFSWKLIVKGVAIIGGIGWFILEVFRTIKGK